jgi:hypothetical protein
LAERPAMSAHRLTRAQAHLDRHPIVDVPDDTEAPYWAGRIVVAVGWPPEVRCSRIA